MDKKLKKLIGYVLLSIPIMFIIWTIYIVGGCGLLVFIGFCIFLCVCAATGSRFIEESEEENERN